MLRHRGERSVGWLDGPIIVGHVSLKAGEVRDLSSHIKGSIGRFPARVGLAATVGQPDGRYKGAQFWPGAQRAGPFFGTALYSIFRMR